MKWSFGRDVDMAKLHAWANHFNLFTLRCWGLFIGNTFIGIARARK